MSQTREPSDGLNLQILRWTGYFRHCPLQILILNLLLAPAGKLREANRGVSTWPVQPAC